jgi:aspartyl-tRNA(Asn)/glutamyl-tRNA(Gln) amidotransferase subunit C
MRTRNKNVEMDVGYVAKLAHIDLSAEETAALQQQLGDVLGYMRQLADLDLEGVEPAAHGVPASNLFREDMAQSGLAREVALANAPARLGDEFKVPKIVE